MVKRNYFSSIVFYGFIWIGLTGLGFGDTAALLEQLEQYKAIISADPNSDEAFSTLPQSLCIRQATMKSLLMQVLIGNLQCRWAAAST